MEEFHQEGLNLAPSFKNISFIKNQSKIRRIELIILMNISPHLLIDAIILSSALTITLVLRAKGNAEREEKEIK